MQEISFQHLKEIASLFLKLGTIGFGGPVAHMAMMEDEIVTKRQWILNVTIVILAAGLLGMIWFNGASYFKGKNLKSILPPVFFIAGPIATQSISQSISLTKLFFVFLKVGALLFGSGYVLVAYLDNDLVNSLGWLTHTDLLNAIAIGQFTPGPVLSTATFIGYQIDGIGGAVMATAGIF